MTHDPMCPDYPHTRRLVCQCALIARVRAEERELVTAELQLEAQAVEQEPCCDHECTTPEWSPPPDDAEPYICARGHWHSPLTVCAFPGVDGYVGTARCPGGHIAASEPTEGLDPDDYTLAGADR